LRSVGLVFRLVVRLVGEQIERIVQALFGAREEVPLAVEREADRRMFGTGVIRLSLSPPANPAWRHRANHCAMGLTT
jgi:hypothetical protein